MSNQIDISIIMGSASDWPTLKKGAEILEEFNISYEKKIVSAHRSPELMVEFAKSAVSRNIKVIIAGAGGAAHLPGMVASLTSLPVLGVPIQTKSLGGLDSLYSIVQMPGGIPVGTLAIGEAGAKNAALLALRILSLGNLEIRKKLEDYSVNMKNEALSRESELI
ncbi:MAG: 5-(carboxyamino)imidazole ribonucleotide mutase [Leptospiraceae bacterium]|nr:5-(carboxyamino)imidazole ribonucleotide mutase [Leptospiraceae bacterium]